MELDFHHDSLDGFLKIFNNTPHQVDVFTTSKNIAFLKDISYTNNIAFHEFTGGSKFFFLKKHAPLLNASSVIFINTIADDYGAYLAIARKNKTILRVHNANKQFRPLSSIYIYPKFMLVWKAFSYVARQIALKQFLLFRPMINARMQYFTFPDNGIRAYILQNRLVPEHKVIPCIPLKIFSDKDTAYEPLKQVINITMIGATDIRRRHYEPVIGALKLLYSLPSPPAIHLTILGKADNQYGQQVRKELGAIAHPSFSTTFYKSQVPELGFIECIRRTHLIISPITGNATVDIFREVYGRTKTTGSILDFIKFGKVTLVPDHYQPPADLSKFILNYSSPESLRDLVLYLSGGDTLNQLSSEAHEYVKAHYSQPTVLEDTIHIFESIIAS